MQAKTDHKRGFVWGLAFAVTMTISSIWGQAVSSGQFVRAAQVVIATGLGILGVTPMNEMR